MKLAIVTTNNSGWCPEREVVGLGLEELGYKVLRKEFDHVTTLDVQRADYVFAPSIEENLKLFSMLNPDSKEPRDVFDLSNLGLYVSTTRSHYSRFTKFTVGDLKKLDLSRPYLSTGLLYPFFVKSMKKEVLSGQIIRNPQDLSFILNSYGLNDDEALYFREALPNFFMLENWQYDSEPEDFMRPHAEIRAYYYVEDGKLFLHPTPYYNHGVPVGELYSLIGDYFYTSSSWPSSVDRLLTSATRGATAALAGTLDFIVTPNTEIHRHSFSLLEPHLGFAIGYYGTPYSFYTKVLTTYWTNHVKGC